MRISDWSSDVCSSDLKYKRRYLRDFGFEIHEFKPFPADAPIDPETTGAFGVSWRDDGTPVFTQAALPEGRRPLGREYSALRWSGFSANEPVPLERGGVRSEEHTSELQSLMRISYAVFCLKKKKR